MTPNPKGTADLVKYIEEILNGKLYFLCSGSSIQSVCLERGRGGSTKSELACIGACDSAVSVRTP